MATNSRAEWFGPAPGKVELTSRWALLLAAACGLAFCGSALARGVENERAVCVMVLRGCGSPTVETSFSASFSPKALGRREQTPVVMRTAMEFKMSDGSRPPALHEFEIGIDQHARMNLKGVPVCRPGNVDEPPIQQRCKEALIGTGKMVSDIRFPESTVPPVHSDVTIYKAGLRNRTRILLAVTYITIPTPAEIVSTIAVERGRGRYGLKLVGSVPKIAGGSGSITHLGLRFHRGVFSATCQDGHLDTHFNARFADGTLLGGAAIRTCTPAA